MRLRLRYDVRYNWPVQACSPCAAALQCKATCVPAADRHRMSEQSGAGTGGDGVKEQVITAW